MFKRFRESVDLPDHAAVTAGEAPKAAPAGGDSTFKRFSIVASDSATACGRNTVQNQWVENECRKLSQASSDHITFSNQEVSPTVATVAGFQGVADEYRHRLAGYLRRGMAPTEAAGRAYGHAQLDWHRAHGERVPPGYCAGCGAEIMEPGILALPDGAVVHGLDCLVIYGERWRGAAEAGLREAGIEPPAGWRNDG